MLDVNVCMEEAEAAAAGAVHPCSSGIAQPRSQRTAAPDSEPLPSPPHSTDDYHYYPKYCPH